MNGKQQLIAFIGAALIIGNLVTNRGPASWAPIGSLLFNQNADTSAGHKALLGLIGEVAVLVFLIVISGLSDTAATLSVVFILGLGLVWFLGPQNPTAAQTLGPTGQGPKPGFTS